MLNPYPRWLANLGLFLSIALCVLWLWEWYSIGVALDSTKTAEYSFGSGSMLEKGGPHYASAGLYSRRMLIDALASIPGIIAFCLAVKRKTAAMTLAAYTIWLGVIRASSVL